MNEIKIEKLMQFLSSSLFIGGAGLGAVKVLHLGKLRPWEVLLDPFVEGKKFQIPKAPASRAVTLAPFVGRPATSGISYPSFLYNIIKIPHVKENLCFQILCIDIQ